LTGAIGALATTVENTESLVEELKRNGIQVQVQNLDKIIH